MKAKKTTVKSLAREVAELRRGLDRNTKVVKKFLAVFERVLREKDALVKAAFERAGHTSMAMTRGTYDRGIRRVTPLK